MQTEAVHQASKLAPKEAPPEDRMTTVRRLRSNGWRQNALCSQLQLGDEQIGGPTYMQGPDGLFYAVREGEKKHQKLHGEYRSKTEARTSVVMFKNGAVE